MDVDFVWWLARHAPLRPFILPATWWSFHLFFQMNNRLHCRQVVLRIIIRVRVAHDKPKWIRALDNDDDDDGNNKCIKHPIISHNKAHLLSAPTAAGDASVSASGELRSLKWHFQCNTLSKHETRRQKPARTMRTHQHESNANRCRNALWKRRDGLRAKRIDLSMCSLLAAHSSKTIQSWQHMHIAHTYTHLPKWIRRRSK